MESEVILERELPAFKRAVEEYTRKALRTKKSAAEALASSGIYTPAGVLTERYR